MPPASPVDPLVGVQLGSYSVFDEGVNRCLDTLALAAVDTLVPYALGGSRMPRPPGRDPNIHGAPDPEPTPVTSVWVDFDPAEFRDTTLPRPESPEGQYAGCDVLAELAEPARQRGMRLHPRILEHIPRDPRFTRVFAIDAEGGTIPHPCWRHPDYRAWWHAIVTSLFRNHDLHGFHFGAERAGPLSEVLVWSRPGGCFCPHCESAARARGISVERARAGMIRLQAFARAMRGEATPVEGVLVPLLRLLLEYPEIAAWERLWVDGRFELEAVIAGAAHALKADAQVGLHVWHYVTTFDPLAKASFDYRAMAAYADYLKPVLYHDVAGPRMNGMLTMGYLDGGLLRELRPAQALDFVYAVMGTGNQGSLEELACRGFNADYVHREITRCVAAVDGRARVHAGIGMDVPNSQRAIPSDPGGVEAAIDAAMGAGSEGIILCREYEEMSLPNLRAAGRAARRHGLGLHRSVPGMVAAA